MFNISIEVPSGARSRGYDRPEEAVARKVFDQVIAYVRAWPGFKCDVILTELDIEVQREHISNEKS